MQSRLVAKGAKTGQICIQVLITKPFSLRVFLRIERYGDAATSGTTNCKNFIMEISMHCPISSSFGNNDDSFIFVVLTNSDCIRQKKFIYPKQRQRSNGASRRAVSCWQVNIVKATTVPSKIGERFSIQRAPCWGRSTDNRVFESR